MSPSPAAEPAGAKTDGAPTTPACDQCRARKIRCNRQHPECLNCRKAGVTCAFSNRGKRVNHTRQLLDDFSGLGARLASIDQSIATISRRISSADHTPSSASRASEVDDLDLFYTRQGSENPEQDTRTSQLGEVFHIISRRFDDSECEHGSTVALSLIESCRRDLGEILGTCQGKGNGQTTAFTAKDASLKTELQILYDSFPFLNSCRDPDFTSDGKAISSPPRSFIHTVIDCFLSNINIATPIFDESRLRVAIEHNDSGLVSDFMEAKSLCYSNIILLTLGLKSRLARRNCSNGNGMDDDLLMSFWKNSRRAFGHLDNYLEPRLINVQALATLAMVAREYCEIQVFERLCHLACLVAKSIGLQRLPTDSKGTMTEKDSESTQLFWALYVMDKERVFMTGQPCDLYFFDTDMQLLEAEPDCTLPHYTVAHTHMMSLWEEIYISLYSSGARRKGSSHRFNQVSRLSSLLRTWGYKYKTLLNAPLEADASTRDCLQLELKYCFHVGQILIHRCGREEDSKQQRINSVYSALNIIKDIHGATPSVGNVALLGRIFRCYPAVAFIDLHTRILHSPEARKRANVELLKTVAEALSPFKDSNFPQAYYSRLHLGMLWCIKVATAVTKSTDQSSTTTTPESSSGQSETTAPESNRLRRPPILSNASSSATTSPTKMAHNLSQDDSPRPRKRHSPPRSTCSLDMHARTIPSVQRTMIATSMPDSGQNIFSAGPSSSLGEEHPPDPVFVSTGGEFQDWRLPTMDHENGGPFVNVPNLTAGEVYYEAGTFDDFMPHGGSVMEPWEMDITNEMMLDSVQAKRFETWAR